MNVQHIPYRGSAPAMQDLIEPSIIVMKKQLRNVKIDRWGNVSEITDDKGRHGGRREGAGHPKGVPGGGHAGRQPGAIDKQLSSARVVPMAEKWDFAETALSHAYRMLNILVSLAEDVKQPGGVRMMAADKVIDRAMGRAPQHLDISAKRHTDIVYQSAEELRAKIRAAIEEEGVPRALMDLTVEPVVDDEDDE